MKVWKRCLAAVLAFMIFATSVNISEAAGTYDSKNYIWTASAAEVVADSYGFDEKEKNVLVNDAVNQGKNYILYAPYNNGTKGKKDLIAVDYVNQVIYAKSLYTGGCSWQPTVAVIYADGEEKEVITLTSGTFFYDDVEYNASQAFTYDGNSYTVEVKYQLSIGVSTAEQTRLLQIPAIFAQTAENLEVNLRGVRLDVKKLGEMLPSLSQLLTLELEKEETITQDVTNENGEEVTETVTIKTKEAALDPTEDAEEIAAITALNKEYTENSGLILYNRSEEYKNSSKGILSYTFENGAKVLEESAKLHGYVTTLKDSSRLKKVIRELYTADPELYNELKYLQTTLKSLVGTASKPGELTKLKNTDNWKILDETVKSQIFAKSYSEESFAALENAVYALKNSSPEIPVAESETLIGDEIGVTCEITIYDIHITVNGEAVSGELEDPEVYPLESYSDTITLLEGTSEEELKAAITENGIEKTALTSWNSQNSHYQINTSNYERNETGISGELTSDIEYVVSYSPKYYKVDTNYRGNDTVPYGFLMELPVSSDEEISYDYVVETEDGTKVSYNEGVTYKITQSVSITQMEGSEKTEYRLYDILVDDIQYVISDEAKQILTNSAVNSPTLKIRVPDGSKVGEVKLENGVYSVQADEVSSGIFGMTWVPYQVAIMDKDTLIEEVLFENGLASWTTSSFTHVKISYQLKIEKVKDGFLNRDLDEIEDVLYALNLPYELVKDVNTQNQLLCGSKGVTVKTLYEQMESISMFMTQGMLSVIGSNMQTVEGQDAVLRLTSSEKQIVKGSSGKKLGYGAWNTSANELALYSYMRLCEDANWSLAVYYQKGYYELIANQAAIVAECLEAITKDPGFDALLSLYNMTDQKARIENLIPQMKELSVSLSGPHQALDANDAEFASLIKLLISLEGQVSAVEASNGIYAYSSVRRNGENSGSLTVSVQTGSSVAKTKEISYYIENGSHVLTEEEAAMIQSYIQELETAWGLTEDEKQYYDLIATAIPQAGETVGKNEIVSFVYSPKEYVVTIAGMDDYEGTFKYKSDHVIELPAYSADAEELNYYCYLIKGEEKKVYNGSCGYYTFTKEDLTEIFVNQHYEITFEIRQNISEWDVVPDVVTSDKVIRGYYLDFDNKLLLLDAAPTGVTISQFEQYVGFATGAGAEVSYSIYNANKDSSKYNYLATDSTVECYSTDQNGEECITTYTLIFMGDVNKDSLVNKADAEMLQKNYLGTAEDGEVIGDSSAKLAADMNGNGKYYDSNDALQIVLKYTNWSADSEKAYVSVL